MKQKKIEERERRLKKARKLKKAGSMARSNSLTSSEGTPRNEEFQDKNNPKVQKIYFFYFLGQESYSIRYGKRGGRRGRERV